MLPANTQINTSDETYMIGDLIEKLANGHQIHVSSYDTRKQHPKTSEVCLTRSSDSKDFVLLQFDRGETLVITPDHRLYDVENQLWVAADKITIDTRCTTLNGFSHVERTHKIRNPMSEKVYTLTVELQNFFANQILVQGR